jgi:hypothetical protein
MLSSFAMGLSPTADSGNNCSHEMKVEVTLNINNAGNCYSSTKLECFNGKKNTFLYFEKYTKLILG